MKRFFIFFMAAVLAVFWWRDFVASGRFLAELDKNPNRRGTATALFVLGRYYDIFNDEPKAVEAYKRVVDRYPKSRYGMEAQFGVANCYERLKRFDVALEQYQKFLEQYPDSKYTVSVHNNIEILKSR